MVRVSVILMVMGDLRVTAALGNISEDIMILRVIVLLSAIMAFTRVTSKVIMVAWVFADKGFILKVTMVLTNLILRVIMDTVVMVLRDITEFTNLNLKVFTDV